MLKSELLALPYGDATATATLSKSELLALDYGGSSPFAQGMTSDDFRVQVQAHGEIFRFWDALKAPGENRNEKVFIEAALPIGTKGYFYQSRQIVESEEFGLVPVGSSMFSCLPDECEIVGDGYLLRNDPAQWRIGKASITRGSGAVDILPERFVRQIVKVIVNGTAVELSQVEAETADSPNDDDLGGLRWLYGAPSAGAKMFVLFRYSPFFVCLGEMIQGSPTGSDGKRLPQNVLLKKERE